MSAAEKFRLFDLQGDEDPDEERFYLQMLDSRGRLVCAADITEDEWRFEARRGRLLAMLRGYRHALRATATQAAASRLAQRALFAAPAEEET